MPHVLAVSPGAHAAFNGSLGDSLSVEVVSDPAPFLAAAADQAFDLLVLSGLHVDEQQTIVSRFHESRRWRLVPVLYTTDPGVPGLAIPGTFRPDMDAIVRGTLDDPEVRRRIVAMAREGVASAEMIVAGPYELDPLRSVLRLPGLDIEFTERESEVLAVLLAQPNRTVSAAEIIERGWGTEADPRYVQVLRRHISNIRRKLERTPAARSVRTVRGAGYRFDVKRAG